MEFVNLEKFEEQAKKLNKSKVITNQNEKILSNSSSNLFTSNQLNQKNLNQSIKKNQKMKKKIENLAQLDSNQLNLLLKDKKDKDKIKNTVYSKNINSNTSNNFFKTVHKNYEKFTKEYLSPLNNRYTRNSNSIKLTESLEIESNTKTSKKAFCSVDKNNDYNGNINLINYIHNSKTKGDLLHQEDNSINEMPYLGKTQETSRSYIPLTSRSKNQLKIDFSSRQIDNENQSNLNQFEQTYSNIENALNNFEEIKNQTSSEILKILSTKLKVFNLVNTLSIETEGLKKQNEFLSNFILCLKTETSVIWEDFKKLIGFDFNRVKNEQKQIETFDEVLSNLFNCNFSINSYNKFSKIPDFNTDLIDYMNFPYVYDKKYKQNIDEQIIKRIEEENNIKIFYTNDISNFQESLNIDTSINIGNKSNFSGENFSSFREQTNNLKKGNNSLYSLNKVPKPTQTFNNFNLNYVKTVVLNRNNIYDNQLQHLKSNIQYNNNLTFTPSKKEKSKTGELSLNRRSDFKIYDYDFSQIEELKLVNIILESSRKSNLLDSLFLDFCQFIRLNSKQKASFLGKIWDMKFQTMKYMVYNFKNLYENTFMSKESIRLNYLKIKDEYINMEKSYEIRTKIMDKLEKLVVQKNSKISTLTKDLKKAENEILKLQQEKEHLLLKFETTVAALSKKIGRRNAFNSNDSLPKIKKTDKDTEKLKFDIEIENLIKMHQVRYTLYQKNKVGAEIKREALIGNNTKNDLRRQKKEKTMMSIHNLVKVKSEKNLTDSSNYSSQSLNIQLNNNKDTINSKTKSNKSNSKSRSSKTSNNSSKVGSSKSSSNNKNIKKSSKKNTIGSFKNYSEGNKILFTKNSLKSSSKNTLKKLSSKDSIGSKNKIYETKKSEIITAKTTNENILNKFIKFNNDEKEDEKNQDKKLKFSDKTEQQNLFNNLNVKSNKSNNKLKRLQTILEEDIANQKNLSKVIEKEDKSLTIKENEKFNLESKQQTNNKPTKNNIFKSFKRMNSKSLVSSPKKNELIKTELITQRRGSKLLIPHSNLNLYANKGFDLHKKEMKDRQTQTDMNICSLDKSTINSDYADESNEDIKSKLNAVEVILNEHLKTNYSQNIVKALSHIEKAIKSYLKLKSKLSNLVHEIEIVYRDKDKLFSTVEQSEQKLENAIETYNEVFAIFSTEIDNKNTNKNEMVIIQNDVLKADINFIISKIITNNKYICDLESKVKKMKDALSELKQYELVEEASNLLNQKKKFIRNVHGVKDRDMKIEADKLKKAFNNISSEYAFSMNRIKIFLTLKKCIKIINTIIFEIVEAVFFIKDKTKLNDLDHNIYFEEVMRIYFIQNFGIETLAKRKYLEFIKALDYYKKDHKRVMFFIKLINLTIDKDKLKEIIEEEEKAKKQITFNEPILTKQRSIEKIKEINVVEEKPKNRRSTISTTNIGKFVTAKSIEVLKNKKKLLDQLDGKSKILRSNSKKLDYQEKEEIKDKIERIDKIEEKNKDTIKDEKVDSTPKSCFKFNSKNNLNILNLDNENSKNNIEKFDNFVIRQLCIIIQLIKQNYCILKMSNTNSDDKENYSIYLSVTKIYDVISILEGKFKLNNTMRNNITSYIENHKFTYIKDMRNFSVIDFDDFIEFISEIFKDIIKIFSVDLISIFKAVDIEEKGYLNYFDFLICFQYLFKPNYTIESIKKIWDSFAEGQNEDQTQTQIPNIFDFQNQNISETNSNYIPEMNIEESIKSESHLSNFNKSNFQEDIKVNKNETSYLKANLNHIEPFNSNNLVNLAKDKENEFLNYINQKGYLTFENLEIVIIEKEVLDRMRFFEFLKIDEESIYKVILNFKASAQTGSFFIYENLKKRIINIKTLNNFQPFITVKIDKLKLALTSDVNISNKGIFFV